MASIHLQGTSFQMDISPVAGKADVWAQVKLAIVNEYVSYKQTEKVSLDSLETWMFCMFRLLAGAYKREYSLDLEGLGVAVDLYPYMQDGNEVSREERRKQDCVMAVRMLMRSKKGEFLGGVYSLLFHRKELEIFAKALQTEFRQAFVKRVHGIGEYRFVGVSPLGYTGCNYWYFDPSGSTKTGDYVWVEMGSHNTKQIAFVDNARWFKKETAPYNLDNVKRILGVATEEELQAFCEEKGIIL